MNTLPKVTSIRTISENQQSNISQMIEIEKLIPHPDNEYLFGMNENDIDNMIEGIKKNGFKGAIEAWDLKDGTYMIYSGHIRTEAFKRMGKTEINAFIDPLPEKETVRRRLLLGANIYGRNKLNDADPVHMARQIAYMRETLKLEGLKNDYRTELAKEFNTSGSNIQRYEAIIRLNEDIQEKVNQAKIPLTVGASVSAMNEEMQDKTIKAIEKLKEDVGENVITRNVMQNIVSEIKKNGEVEEVIENHKNALVLLKKEDDDNTSLTIECVELEQENLDEIENDNNDIEKYADGDFKSQYHKMLEMLKAKNLYKDKKDIIVDLKTLKEFIDLEINRLEQK